MFFLLIVHIENSLILFEFELLYQLLLLQQLKLKLHLDKKVLDIFSYAGGFSVHALTSGAKSVTSLDISSQALLIAKQNASLNSFIGKHITIADDAFVAMNKLIAKKEVYDVVVIDPPSFAKSKSEISLAKKKYKQLAEIGAKLTAKNGYLILFSFSLALKMLGINIVASQCNDSNTHYH